MQFGRDISLRAICSERGLEAQWPPTLASEMYEFLRYQVRHVMTGNPVKVAPAARLADVQALFERHDFDAVPVVDDAGRLLAIVSKLDLLKAFVFTTESIVPPYADIMQRPIDDVARQRYLRIDRDGFARHGGRFGSNHRRSRSAQGRQRSVVGSARSRAAGTSTAANTVSAARVATASRHCLVDRLDRGAVVLVENGRLVGMVAREDVLGALRRAASGKEPA